MSTETYKLPWLQSTSDFATSQDVVAKINSGSATILTAGLLMNISEYNYNFDTAANVEWWITTHHENGIDKLDSSHATFTAINKATLVAAVPGTAVWISHNP